VRASARRMLKYIRLEVAVIESDRKKVGMFRLFRTIGANRGTQRGIRRYATYRRFNAPQHQVDWNKRAQWGGGFLILGGIVYVSNLDSAPYSNRNRFIIIGPKLEKKIGERGYRETMSEFGRQILPDNHPQTIRVKRIMDRLIRASHLEHMDWKIHVIDDPKTPPNAFVLPGGKVFVFTSILPICHNDDGLATVLAHETGHQLARHTAENLSKTPFYIVLGLLLSTVTGADMINRLVVNTLFQLPASREMEREADYIGLMMMSKACFNPSEAVGVWERMTQFEQKMAKGSSKVPEFLSTHPTSSNRITLIQQWLSEANSVRAQAGCDEFGGLMDSFWR
jgi:predicted Zn-dependent protease